MNVNLAQAACFTAPVYIAANNDVTNENPVNRHYQISADIALCHPGEGMCVLIMLLPDCSL
jgi:hypothetical protein